MCNKKAGSEVLYYYWQDVVGQNFVGQDVTGAISLGQEVSGAGGSGAGSRES